jgi:hypothetical protein
MERAFLGFSSKIDLLEFPEGWIVGDRYAGTGEEFIIETPGGGGWRIRTPSDIFK